MAKTKNKNMGPPRPVPPSVEQVEEVDNSHSSEEELMPSSHQASGVSSTATKPKKRKERSEAWTHYDRIVNEGQDLQAKCKHCGATYMADPNKHGTKNLKMHVKKCKVLLSQKGPMDNYTISHDGDTTSSEMRPYKLDSNLIRATLIEWIICEELPFRIVESEKFKEFCKAMNPRYAVPSRMTVARHIFKMYNAQKEKLKEALKGSVGRVSLTTNMWTSLNNSSYMCITAHFIDKSWKLHKRMISFCMVEDRRAEGIEKQLEKVTKEWGIEKIMCITADTASANEGAVEWMKKYGCKHVLDGSYLHVRCFAHILNIIVKFGLHRCIISVERIRNVVKYVRSSLKRLSKFLECTKQVGVTSTKSLCLDVATRWNSTYLMLEAAVEYELVFDRLYDEDLSYQNSFSNGFVVGVPTFDDWMTARELIHLLRPFYNATVALSGSSDVTFNNYFYQFQTIRDHLKNAQINRYKVISNIVGGIMEKYDQYFGNISKVNMLVYVALVLDPRSKLDIFKNFLQRTFDEKTSDELYEGTKKLLQDLYEEYHSILGAPQSQSRVSQVSGRNDTSSSSTTSSTLVSNVWDVVCDRTEYATSLSKSEIDKYLADDPEKQLDGFDLLNFWKVMEGRFPILASIARDIFSIPASTVASEFSFSTGCCVITARRSSLLPRTVEALLCTQSWIKNVIAIDANQVILNDEDAQEVERAAEEELDGVAGHDGGPGPIVVWEA